MKIQLLFLKNYFFNWQKIPTVHINAFLNESRVYRNRIQLFPTVLSPINITLTVLSIEYEEIIR